MQIPYHARRGAPNMPCPKLINIIMPRKPLPFTPMALAISRVHQKGKRHLEGLIDFISLQ